MVTESSERLMHPCAWCGATGDVRRTKVLDDPGSDIDPLWLCRDRAPCRKRMATQTDKQLTGAPR